MEIYQVPQEKNFVGKAKFKMKVLHYTQTPQDLTGVWDGRFIMERQLESSDDLKTFARDPGIQQNILDAAADTMRGRWSNKVLSKTWHETKDMFMATYKDVLNAFLESLRFDLYVSYEIKIGEDDPNGNNPRRTSIFSSPWETDIPANTVRSNPELVRHFLLHELIDEGSLEEMKAIFARGLEVMVESEMKPFMEDEVTRKENDLQLLRILTKRYPNFQELIKEETVNGN